MNMAPLFPANAPAGANVGPRSSAALIHCINPATGETLGEVPVTSPDEVRAVVERARIAQAAWGRSTFAQRRAVLRHLMDIIVERMDEICKAVVEDSGKTFENALLGEVMPVCNKIRWVMKNGEKYLRPEKVPSGLLLHKKGRIEYLPLGVVACIVPWNYPFQNIFGSFVAPLMAGNAVVVKASEAVAWSTRFFQTLIDEALRREGFSPDTVQIVNGFGETGAALVRARVQKILFIGSVGNGRRIIEGSAVHLTPTVMELGGKDPMIICEDADLEHAVHSALGGCFINLGQNCIASERIIVLDGIHDRFVAEFARRAAALRQGAPRAPGTLDVGAINTRQQIQVIDDLVRDAIASGARALTGGTLPEGPGQFYPPTVLAGVTPAMRIAREEIFGPVALIFRARDDAEALAIANGTDFGLHSSVFTRNRARGERIAAALDTGATCINDFGLCYLNQDLPFGGVKYSGFGRMNGREGLRSYTNAKAVLSDRLPFAIPPRLYPVGPKVYGKTRHTIRLLFARGLGAKLGALAGLIR
ncbi:aldehyde dehydrogenase family protein [Zavarzinia compransoris]|uniref:Aldehyde dehydrogenase n=1 Tax=Zavarzinia compransoris TaxID=1264899 RepID=A0A317E5D1_9PROT|nr:aldehyde dehydrogenase family protein [Zavarzinia compransoris]PWR22209.1 succinate-semialdehyde dehydrogenase [Zavarzinia compransoris]TDP47038.1 acyl-CoA reductase-like NAD-dependent aldehyde dehydrogenase [Zavarzinia compransoris]